MTLLRLEVDGHLADQKIHRIDLAEAPALMHDVGAWLEEFEGLAGCRCQFSSFNGLLDFGMHGGWKIGRGAGLSKTYLARPARAASFQRENGRFRGMPFAFSSREMPALFTLAAGCEHPNPTSLA